MTVLTILPIEMELRLAGVHSILGDHESSLMDTNQKKTLNEVWQYKTSGR